MRAWETAWPPARGTEHDAEAPEAPTSDVDGTGLPALGPKDRCDSCGAQAYVRVRLPDGGELLFCGHHGHALHDLLLATGARLRDDTHLLLAR